jgi:hypothetical protein
MSTVAVVAIILCLLIIVIFSSTVKEDYRLEGYDSTSGYENNLGYNTVPKIYEITPYHYAKIAPECPDAIDPYLLSYPCKPPYPNN